MKWRSSRSTLKSPPPTSYRGNYFLCPVHWSWSIPHDHRWGLGHRWTCSSRAKLLLHSNKMESNPHYCRWNADLLVSLLPTWKSLQILGLSFRQSLTPVESIPPFLGETHGSAASNHPSALQNIISQVQRRDAEVPKADTLLFMTILGFYPWMPQTGSETSDEPGKSNLPWE